MLIKITFRLNNFWILNFPHSSTLPFAPLSAIVVFSLLRPRILILAREPFRLGMAFIGRGQEGEEGKLMFYSIYFSCIQKQAIKSLGRKLKRAWQRQKQFLKKLLMFISLFCLFGIRCRGKLAESNWICRIKVWCRWIVPFLAEFVCNWAFYEKSGASLIHSQNVSFFRSIRYNST